MRAILNEKQNMDTSLLPVKALKRSLSLPPLSYRHSQDEALRRKNASAARVLDDSVLFVVGVLRELNRLDVAHCSRFRQRRNAVADNQNSTAEKKSTSMSF